MSTPFVEDQSVMKTEQRTGYGTKGSMAIGIARVRVDFTFRIYTQHFR